MANAHLVRRTFIRAMATDGYTAEAAAEIFDDLILTVDIGELSEDAAVNRLLEEYGWI